MVPELRNGEVRAQLMLDTIYESWMPGIEIDRGPNREGWPTHDAILRVDGRHWRVEEKIRHPDPQGRIYTSDILIELVDGLAEGVLYPERRASKLMHGWLFHVEADVFVYVWCDANSAPQKLFRAPWGRFRQRVNEYFVRTRRGNWVSSTKGDRGVALNVVIPLGEFGDVGEVRIVTDWDRIALPF
jgi:hypothetical protein